MEMIVRRLGVADAALDRAALDRASRSEGREQAGAVFR